MPVQASNDICKEIHGVSGIFLFLTSGTFSEKGCKKFSFKKDILHLWQSIAL